MADQKISDLTLSFIGTEDYIPVNRGGSNYKLNLSGVITGLLGLGSNFSVSGDYLVFFITGRRYYMGPIYTS